MREPLKQMEARLSLPAQTISTDVLLEKYAINGEQSAEDIFRRVAKGVAAVEATDDLRLEWEQKFYANMQAGAVGAGRIMASAGANTNSTWVNCFVQPVSDTAYGVDEDGVPGIYKALEMAGETLRRGGGVGYDFSPIRPRGSLVKGTNSEASGPCVFMDIFDASCRSVMAGGNRRGAQMGIMNVSHPDIMEFIQAKRTQGRWNNFNVSVGITDEFMQALLGGHDWELAHKAVPSEAIQTYQREDGLWVYGVLSAQDVWNVIMKSAYDFAEPGVVFLGNMNRENNLRYCEVINATNPCGEQPLPAFGCCDLGQMILPKFVVNSFQENASFDFVAFRNAVRHHVRFLDNVLDGTPWPLMEQKNEAQSKRRIGLGFTGIGNALAMLNLRYNSSEGLEQAREIAEVMRNEAYDASVDLAIERGAFPLFKAEKYLEEGTFASRLPERVKDRIRQHGIRNSHLLSIAPVGTISLAFADNTSNGIEPPFSFAYTRKKRMPDGSSQNYDVLDHAFRVYLSGLGNREYAAELQAAAVAGRDTFMSESEGAVVTRDALEQANLVSALDLNVDEHLAMMRTVQPYIDSAISKTVNVPEDYPFEDFKNIYLRAYEYGLKGVATYRPNSILGSVLSVPTAAKTIAPKAEIQNDVDALRVVLQGRPEGELDARTEKMVYRTAKGEQKLYVSVSFAKVAGVVNGEAVEVERPMEVFIPAAQNDAPVQWVSATMRLLSLAARTGTLSKALTDLRQIASNDGSIRYGWHMKDDGSKVPKFHDSEVAAIAYAIQQMIYRRGLFDNLGSEVPTKVLLARQVKADAVIEDAEALPAERTHSHVHGKPCPECGARAVVRRDGCEICTSCGLLGSCG